MNESRARFLRHSIRVCERIIREVREMPNDFATASQDVMLIDATLDDLIHYRRELAKLS